MDKSVLGLQKPVFFRTPTKKERWFVKYVVEFDKGYVLGTDLDTDNEGKVEQVGSFLSKLVENKHFNVSSLLLADEVKTRDGFSKPLSYLRNAKLPTFFRNENVLKLLQIDEVLDDLWYNDSIRFSKLNGVYSPTIKTSQLVKVIDRVIKNNESKFYIDTDGGYSLKYKSTTFSFTKEQFSIIEKKYNK